MKNKGNLKSIELSISMGIFMACLRNKFLESYDKYSEIYQNFQGYYLFISF